MSIAINYENHAPPAPTSFEVDSVGDKTVRLGWVRPAAADVHHYQVWRSGDGVTFTKIADDVPSESYTDTVGLVNGNVYYYEVRAVDSEGLAGAASDVVSATPILPGDTTAPTVPSPLTAVADAGAATVHLTWAVSSDLESGLSGYTIERSADNVTWAVLQSGYDDVFYDDTAAGWSTSWFYRVMAVNNVAIGSAYASTGPVTTVNEILRSITVTNNSAATSSSGWRTSLSGHGSTPAARPSQLALRQASGSRRTTRTCRGPACRGVTTCTSARTRPGAALS